jgi:hypothetical protein
LLRPRDEAARRTIPMAPTDHVRPRAAATRPGHACDMRSRTRARDRAGRAARGPRDGAADRGDEPPPQDDAQRRYVHRRDTEDGMVRSKRCSTPRRPRWSGPCSTTPRSTLGVRRNRDDPEAAHVRPRSDGPAKAISRPSYRLIKD